MLVNAKECCLIYETMKLLTYFISIPSKSSCTFYPLMTPLLQRGYKGSLAPCSSQITANHDTRENLSRLEGTLKNNI